MFRRCVVVTLVTLFPLVSAQAQRPDAVVAVGSTVGAAVGAVVGGFIGGSISGRNCESGNPDYCLGKAMPGGIWGIGIGTTLGAPLGAHLTAKPRGDLMKSTLVSAGIFAIEVVALNALVEDGHTQHINAVRNIAISAPVLQIISSVVIERLTRR